jgi:hypothetical protein
MNETPSKLNPALAGGAFIGLLSSLPLLNMGNCCCCMWVLAGGVLAAYLYERKLPPEMEFSGGDGAIVGLIAGVFGALFGSLLNYIMIGVLDMNPARDFLEMLTEAGDNVPEEVSDYLSEFEDPSNMSSAFAVIGLIFSLIVNSIFATVGGIIGASILKKKRRPSPGGTY